MPHTIVNLNYEIIAISLRIKLDVNLDRVSTLDLSELLRISVVDLSMFLRQNSRSLKQLSLQALDALLQAPSTLLSEQICVSVLQESALLLSDSDLHSASLTLKLLLSLLAKADQRGQVIFMDCF